jgi:hypothetical protein
MLVKESNQVSKDSDVFDSNNNVPLSFGKSVHDITLSPSGNQIKDGANRNSVQLDD